MSSHSYFITGGYGLIGSALANATDGTVTILTRSDRHKERIKKRGVKVITKDLLDINEADIKGQDIIYHCASTVDNYHVLTDPFIDVETNIKGTIKLLEACKNLSKKPKIIFFQLFLFMEIFMTKQNYRLLKNQEQNHWPYTQQQNFARKASLSFILVFMEFLILYVD